MNKKLNLVLDLDNTLISSLEKDEITKKIENRKLEYKDMDGYYRVFSRPHLKTFIDYAFNNFDITIWTAASKDYALFIINKILIPKSSKKHKLKMFLYDENCDQSREKYHKESPKDLNYLYNFSGYHSCNTIIMDDLQDVFNANPKNTLRADYFDASKISSERDDFLLRAIDKLEYIKKNYEINGCKQLH